MLSSLAKTLARNNLLSSDSESEEEDEN